MKIKKEPVSQLMRKSCGAAARKWIKIKIKASDFIAFAIGSAFSRKKLT
jgi:hypothetical protein